MSKARRQIHNFRQISEFDDQMYRWLRREIAILAENFHAN
jgi:hypothetical protein